MPVTPNTVVHFLNVPLENNYKNQIYFGNRSDQTTFMLTKRVNDLNGLPLTFSNLTYQRKDNVIRVPRHIDQMLNANYVMYQNTTYTDRWFYAFITKMEYINDGRTDVYIETDVWQTWFDKITLKDSFVEREHVTDDTIGKHTVPECLETGEYICNELVRDLELQDYSYVLLVSDTYDDEVTSKPLAINMGGIFYAGGAYICSTMQQVVSIINLYDQKGKGEAITSVYMLPSKIINETVNEDEPEALSFNGQSSPKTYDITFSKQTKLDGYSPKNNKLKCYPYNYIAMSNNNGSSNILQYEHFSGSECEFEVTGIPVIGGSIKCAPLNYKGLERYQDEGIMCGKFPTLSWSSDLFTNWLTQNAVNIGLGIASSGLTVIGGLAMMGTGAGAVAGAGAVVSGGLGIANTLGQVYQHSFTPASAQGNINGGDINTAYKMNTFYFHKMSIKKEYAQIIDKYFEMFGYKVNTVKTPVLSSRPHWNYIKTIGVNLDGQAPQEDLKKIRQMFDNGVTFWKNGNEVEDYSLNNH